MAPSSKSLKSCGNTSSVIVSVASPPNIILVTEEGIALIVSLNGFWSRSSVEEGHSQELPLAIIVDAPSEWEAREHVTFRVVLDGFKKWSYVSHNPFLSNSTEFSSMEHKAPLVPLCIDTTDEIPLANIAPTRVISKVRRGKHIASKPSSSKPKTSTNAKPKTSLKPTSKFKSTKHSTSKSKKHHVASPVPSDSSLSDSDAEYLSQTNPFVSPSQLDRIIHFCKKSVLRGRVVTSFGGPQMAVLLTNLEVQGWSTLFLHGDTQYKLAKKEVTEFYINGKSDELSFTTTPHLPNHTSALSISRKFSSKTNLTHHRGVDKNEMSPLHQLYFDVVHKIILQRKQRRTKANFHDLNLMELLDTERLKNQLAAKEDQLLAMENAHQMEKASLEARIVELQNELSQERAANIAIVQHPTQLLHDPKPTSAS
ncbi:hypothetical protein MTR67_031530 [Solanum verrucosum]|uniref:Uncharacterized protein n=1 Tax=Solanum verrucosum TaxID=315347 RepID=A0AAF0U2M3_SOLVR|nr:hypothetical protein MTR67_031530 [Solanum verrucosum]